MEPWSVTELTSAFRRVANAESLPLRVCFLINGLDEYDSDHAELFKVLRDAASSPHIKLCVSSRPWDVFDFLVLTEQNIRDFVADQLHSHPRWVEAISRGTPDQQIELIDRIATQADGVFI